MVFLSIFLLTFYKEGLDSYSIVRDETNFYKKQMKNYIAIIYYNFSFMLVNQMKNKSYSLNNLVKFLF